MHKGMMYRATLWIASKTMGFSVAPWPDFEWSDVGVLQTKPIFHKEFPIQKNQSQDIDYYIEHWKKL